MGVAQTGNFGFGFQTSCLIFCVASVFAPGSVFDYHYLIPGYNENNVSLTTTMSNNTNIYDVAQSPTSYTSVNLLVAGIILSRCGELLIFFSRIIAVLNIDVFINSET